ncbi:Dolichyl-phosphate-mannose-protein mannosyltransferase [Rhodopseudomonas pseudopalustris]|uniref:Dolichyl-phosphate-mannose-protein mannosyltransferase n=2 Tax=Rhodopseudomonas pseudopalustris TaxID=1513892 RepID=A0A1H8NPU5_9BRAD|nr:Dolichyl-phosphate-mannose-protein mannosyltransferase [Rhodopseudomonas pseudopalustris]
MSAAKLVACGGGGLYHGPTELRWPLMRFTSLIIELIRARPRLMFWLVVSAQALLWVLVPLLVYSSPPEGVATVLAYGREYQVGSDLGPPLAFWLADIAFRAAGGHMVGVYLLAQVCFIITFYGLFQLARSMVGPQHAVIAVLLTSTVTAFAEQGAEFGPLVLARPLWALVLWHSWEIIGRGRRSAWFALSIEVGLLLLTTVAAPALLLLPIGFALSTARSRRALMSLDPLFSLLVVAVLVLPYGIWLLRADIFALPPLPALGDLGDRALLGAELFGGLLVAIGGMALLVLLNTSRFDPRPDDAPVVYRAPVDPLARQFVYFFALAPALLGAIVAGLFGLKHVIGGAGIALLMVGLAVVIATGDLIHLRRQRVLRAAWAALVAAPALAVIVASVVQPWVSQTELATSLPAKDIARYFGDSFERRTGRPLSAVAGDPELAGLIAMGASRPHLFLDATPSRTPWVTPATFNERGGVVVWRAADTAGRPPPELAMRFPDIVPELPRAFERMIAGRQPLLRIGWAIVRPKAAP